MKRVVSRLLVLVLVISLFSFVIESSASAVNIFFSEDDIIRYVINNISLKKLLKYYDTKELMDYLLDNYNTKDLMKYLFQDNESIIDVSRWSWSDVIESEIRDSKGETLGDYYYRQKYLDEEQERAHEEWYKENYGG